MMDDSPDSSSAEIANSIGIYNRGYSVGSIGEKGLGHSHF